MKAVRRSCRLAAALLAPTAIFAGAAAALLGSCGPFSDFTDAAFCPFVLEIFTLGITTGTTPTTYDPASPVSRVQMAAFLSRTVDGTLKRGSRRAALGQTAIPQSFGALGITTVGAGPRLLRFDGADVWVANFESDSVSRVRASDGKLLETWTGAVSAFGVLAAMGRIFVTGFNFSDTPGNLYRIDPGQPAGSVETVATNLGAGPTGIAFDGSRIWVAGIFEGVSIVTPGATLPWTVTTVTAGFSAPQGILYDGSNVWVADINPGTLLKLGSTGSILQTVTLTPGDGPNFPVFDGSNIWVPVQNPGSVSVVRASTGAVLATLTGNGLAGAIAAAFDGQRILVTNQTSLSLWKAADLTPLGSFSTGTNAYGVCSDGVNFWISLQFSSRIARF